MVGGGEFGRGPGPCRIMSICQRRSSRCDMRPCLCKGLLGLCDRTGGTVGHFLTDTPTAADL